MFITSRFNGSKGSVAVNIRGDPSIHAVKYNAKVAKDYYLLANIRYKYVLTPKKLSNIFV